MSKLVVKITSVGVSARGFDMVFDWLASIGLSFRNPSVNAVTAWTDDGQITTTVETVVESARHRQTGSVQMWFASGNDINLSWAADGMVVFLDGTTVKERAAVIHALIDNLMTVYAQFRESWHMCVGTDDEVFGEPATKPGSRTSER